MPFTKAQRYLWGLTIVLAAALVANVGFLASLKPDAAGKKVSLDSFSEGLPPLVLVRPYTAVLTEVHSRTPEKSVLYTFAVRGDGSFADVSEDVDSVFPVMQRQLGLTTGLLIDVDDFRGLKSTRRAGRGYILSNLRDPSGDCLAFLAPARRLDGQTLVGRETVEGHDTVRIALRGSTFWFAPHSGCAMVQWRTTFGSELIEKRLVSLHTGEPDPNLFAVPSQYSEVKPSVFFFMKPGDRADSMDAAYERRHPKQNPN